MRRHWIWVKICWIFHNCKSRQTPADTLKNAAKISPHTDLICWLARKLSIEPLVAVTTLARKAFCLAANSGSRDRDDLLEAAAAPDVFGLVVFWRLLLCRKCCRWKKRKERFIYTWSLQQDSHRLRLYSACTHSAAQLTGAGFKVSAPGERARHCDRETVKKFNKLKSTWTNI